MQLDRRGFVLCDEQQRTAVPPESSRSGTWRANRCWPTKHPMRQKLRSKPCSENRSSSSPRQSRPLCSPIPKLPGPDTPRKWPSKSGSLTKQPSIRGRPAAGPRALGRAEGMTKWLIDPETQRLLGCGIVGPGAGELISEAVLAIEMGCVARDVTESIHPHPTLSETLIDTRGKSSSARPSKSTNRVVANAMSQLGIGVRLGLGYDRQELEVRRARATPP